LICGSAQAITDDGVIVINYTEGSLFGEKAILTGNLRAINIVALENTFVVKIDP